MKLFLTSFLLFLLTMLDAQPYHLVWEDNFDSLNTDIWLVQNNFDHYGGELQVYTSRPENVFISDGNLVLRVNKEDYSCPPGSINPWGCARQYNTGQPYQYTSGWIETQPAYNTQYGKIEARISLPWGRGFWPAYWTFVGEGLPSHVNAAEIDIFEMYGHKPATHLETNVHLDYCNPDRFDYPDCPSIPSYGKSHIIPNYANKFHIYTLEWSPELIKWKMNDIPLRVMNNPGVVDPVRTIINMALLVGDPPNVNTPFPSDIKIDYVKVYAPGNATPVQDKNLTKNDLQIFPNPAMNTLSVELNSRDQLKIRDIEITDIMGRKLIVKKGLNLEKTLIDLSSLPASHYYLSIFTDNGKITRPFIKF